MLKHWHQPPTNVASGACQQNGRFGREVGLIWLGREHAWRLNSRLDNSFHHVGLLEPVYRLYEPRDTLGHRITLICEPCTFRNRV